MDFIKEANLYLDYIQRKLIGRFLTLNQDITIRINSIELRSNRFETDGLIINNEFLISKEVLDNKVNHN
jgi:hypothetical protein